MRFRYQHPVRASRETERKRIQCTFKVILLLYVTMWKSSNYECPRTEAQQPVSSPYRYVLQVQVLVVHGVAQLPDLLLHFGDFPGTELKVTVYAGPVPTILVQLQQPDHELQTRSVQVHVQAVSAEDVHERRRAQGQVLPRQTQI